MGNLGFWTFFFAHLFMLFMISRLFYKIGRRDGSRREVRSMIELLDSLKIDCWEQSVFRDRFKAALQWTLDGKRKKDRNGKPGGNPDPEA